jgi:uncharacterized protein YndB with AHSA1/START domain
MKIVFRIFVIALLLVGLAYAIGLTIPEHQTHTRSVTIRQTPEAIFALLTDLPNMPKWNRNLLKVETLPPTNGKETTRQTFNGKMTMTVVTSESIPPRRLVRSVTDDKKVFSGSWAYDITPNAGGSQIVLTETSDMANPFLRLMTKVFGPTKYMDQHLEDLAKHFGETAAIR